jgi:hypothetical protein
MPPKAEAAAKAVGAAAIAGAALGLAAWGFAQHKEQRRQVEQPIDMVTPPAIDDQRARVRLVLWDM